MEDENRLQKGFSIKTLFGGNAFVDSYIGEGGQGAVYIVDYNGEKKALKWYKKTGMSSNPQKFYENIKGNVMRGAPSAEFLWPKDITEWRDGVFGYIMDLRPEGYVELGDIMLGKCRMKSFKTICDAALRISKAYWILHNLGYAYQDLNEGNFFINPETGEVLIADNDNVAPEKTETGILGKPRYMAPEITLRKNMPNVLSDRYSLAVILYILLVLNHPLEGALACSAMGDDEEMEKLYGSEPLFVMDPDDDRNRPIQGVHTNVLLIWPCLPEYVKDIFIRAFSQQALHKPSSRPTDYEWMKVFTRFRDDIITCPNCGTEVFTENGASCNCDSCLGKIFIKNRLAIGNYKIPIVKGTRIYRCQLGMCDQKDALSKVAIVAYNSQLGMFGIKNLTDKKWDAVTTKGVNRKVAPGEIVPVKEGIKISVSGDMMYIDN